MNKKGIVIIIAIFSIVVGWKFFLGGSQNNILPPTEEPQQALQKFLQEEKAIFLMFTADSCPACRKAKPWVKDFYQAYHENINFIIADLDHGGKELAQAFGVMGIPHFVFINKEGEVLESFGGYPASSGKEFLQEKFDSIIAQ